MRSALLTAAALVIACTAPATPSPSPTRAPTAAPPASPTLPVRVEVALRRAAFPGSPEGSAVTDVTAHGRANAWYTVDGTTWVFVEERATFEKAAMTTLLALDPGLVAVGASVARNGDRIVAAGVTQRRIEGTSSYVQNAAAWSGTAKGSRGP